MSHQRTLRGLRTFLLLAGVAVACAPGERPPAAPLRGKLALEGERAAATRAEPFQVVFAAPRGETSALAEISVVFSRPLVALETAGAAAPPPITITPALAGAWHWVGTKALRFVPEGGKLPPATRYVVEVPAGLGALDGSTLAEAYRFELSTPRPAIVGSTPYDGARELELETVFELELDQPVDPVRFQAATTLVAERGGKRTVLAYDAVRPEPTLPRRIRLKPRARLPRDAEIAIDVGASLVGEGGPLPSGKLQRLSFHTYGPLTARLDCDTSGPHHRCAPASYVGLSLSQPVGRRALVRALTFEPPLARPLREGAADEETSYLDLTALLAAGTTYTITIAGGLSDRHGQTLGAPHVERVPMDDHFPRVDLGVTGSTFAASAVEPIPVGSINVAAYSLVTASLRPEDVPAFVSEQDRSNLVRLVRALPQAKRRRVTPTAARNTLATELLPLPGVLGGPHGVAAIAVERDRQATEGGPSEAFRLLKVTELGLSAKISRHGSVVWVTRLGTGAPVPGATVRLLVPGAPAREYRTDDSGFATIPPSDFAPDLYGDGGRAVLLAASGGDWTFESVADHVPEWRVPVSMDLSGEQHTYGMLFTERGIYRPGDRVRVKGIVRKESPSGNETPRGQSLTLMLTSPEGEEVEKLAVTTSRFGTFSADLTVPASGSLGSYQLQLKEPVRASTSFDVAEYHPSELAARVEAKARSAVRGDAATFTVHGDYLYGAPMAGAAVRHSITHGPTWYEVPGSEGLVTQASAWDADLDEASLGGGELSSAEAKLDAKGALVVTSRLDLPAQRGPEAVRLDAEITDVSRRTVASGASVVVHPAAHYVGLREPTEYFVPARGRVTPAVVALSPEGERLAGKKVHLELVQRRWTLAREALASGETHAVSRVVDRVAAACDVVTGAQPVGCELAVSTPGYYLVVARSHDARGNVATAAYGLYATGEGPGGGFGDDDRGRVELVPDRKQYAVGDTARVLVKSPFAEAEAWVTVERAGVYRSERVHLRGPTPTVTVPITDALRPNAFVSVHLLRPGTRKARPAGELPYRMGYAELRVDPEARRLAVEVKPSRTEARPGDEVTVDVTVRARGGKPGPTELAVYAVDEGVLMLTGYRTPDPLPVFTAPRPLQVATLEARDSMAKVSLDDLRASLGAEKGAEGGDGGGGARRDFRQTAFFEPAVLTDADGHARVKFRLPESLTTYRVMAVATAEEDRHGFGAASVQVNRRLMARPALPRFVRAGDRLEAGVVVASKSLAAARVTVKASVKGLALLGPAERSIDLPADGNVEVRFPMEAQAVGAATLRFQVEGAGERDAVEVTRRVDPPGKPETVALYGSTRDTAAEQLGDYAAVRRDVGSLSVSLSPSALVGLDAGATALVEYPYSCTEQLTSRLVPLLPLRELARAFAFPMPRDTDAFVGRTVAELLARQKGDGGFGMWPESPRSDPWMSAYATWGLDLAAAHGVKVPAAARARARDHLRGWLASHPDDELSGPSGAFILDVLAEGGAPDPGYAARLFTAREALPTFARALLLHALVVGKGPPDAQATLARELSSELRLANDAALVAENAGDAYAVLLDSTERTQALVLRALIAHDPRHPLGAALARGLLSRRRGGGWGSTQADAFALLSLDAYRRAQEPEAPRFSARAWLGERALGRTEFDGRLRSFDVTLPLSRLPMTQGSALVLEKSGPGTLFYEARLRYVRSTLPATGLDAGFEVQKTLRAVPPEALESALATIPSRGVSEFRPGDLVVADLVIVSSGPRDFVAVDDPLPAGLEAIDASLATTAAWLSVPGSTATEDRDCDDCESARDARAHGRAFESSWYRRELRDDRVLFFVDHLPAGMYHYRYLARATTLGTFVVPPTRVEEMYTPETFGRTGATTVTVR